MPELTARESAILDIVRKSIDTGIAPTVREICLRLDIKSTSTVHRYLTRLEQKGCLLREGNLNRAIRLPDSAVTRVPLFGCGAFSIDEPFPCETQAERYIPLPVSGDASALFAVRMPDDSMCAYGAHMGDLLLIRRAQPATDGDLIAAKINGRLSIHPYPLAAPSPESTVVLGRVAALYREF